MVGVCCSCRRYEPVRRVDIHFGTATGRIVVMSVDLCGKCTCDVCDSAEVIDVVLGYLEESATEASG